MESESFRSRVLTLIQKSRRALRLYTNAGATPITKSENVTAELSAAQVAEWREMNGMLLRKLSEAADSPNAKKLVFDVFALRNEFLTLWKASEGELVQGQRELVACAERGDFIRAASLAAKLVTLKARVQSGQAAHHELDTLIKRSRVVRPTMEMSEEAVATLSTIELLDEQVVRESVLREDDATTAPPAKVAAGAGKIIPLVRKG